MNEGYRAEYGGRVRGEHIAGNLQVIQDSALYGFRYTIQGIPFWGLGIHLQGFKFLPRDSIMIIIRIST